MAFYLYTPVVFDLYQQKYDIFIVWKESPIEYIFKGKNKLEHSLLETDIPGLRYNLKD